MRGMDCSRRWIRIRLRSRHVILAQAGIQKILNLTAWIPACAGMTKSYCHGISDA
jgi:hypothetical protein